MSDPKVKISALPAATALNDADHLAGNQSGITKRFPGSLIVRHTQVGAASGVAGLDSGSLVSQAVKLISPGSVGTPGARFSNDLNTGLYSIAADTLGISTGGVERVRVSSSGISFAGGTANTYLGAYERGTWTPTLSGTTGTAGTYAQSTSTGQYWVIGDMVTITGRVTVSDVGSWTGNVRVNLPFVAAQGDIGGGYVARSIHTLGAGHTGLYLRAITSEAVASVTYDGDTFADYGFANIQAGANARLNFFYTYRK